MHELFDPDDPILRPRQVARVLGVAPRTVTRWARVGLLEAHRTAGGHHRFRMSAVRRFATTLRAADPITATWWG